MEDKKGDVKGGKNVAARGWKGGEQIELRTEKVLRKNYENGKGEKRKERRERKSVVKGRGGRLARESGNKCNKGESLSERKMRRGVKGKIGQGEGMRSAKKRRKR